MWRTIGTELGVDVDTLNAIEKDHRVDNDRLCAVQIYRQYQSCSNTRGKDHIVLFPSHVSISID